MDENRAHQNFQNIKLENVEGLLLSHYRRARYAANLKIQSALFNTLSDAIDGVESKHLDIPSNMYHSIVGQLDMLAGNLGLRPDLESLKKISSGKWLLSTFCEIVYAILGQLSNYCGLHGSEQCDFCRAADSDKCTFRLKRGINNKTLYSSAPEMCQINSLDYVRRRLAQISLATVPWNIVA